MSDTRNMIDVNRRDFLKMSASAGLALGFSVNVSGCSKPDSQTVDADSMLNGWVRMSQDGSVTILIGQSEIGQGITTALAQAVAGELDVPWESVGYELANDDPAHIHPVLYSEEQITGGSASTFSFFVPARKAGAAARAMILDAAARAWDVARDELSTSQGEVLHRDSGRVAGYVEFLINAAQVQPPIDPSLRDDESLPFVGKSVARLDSPDKVRGLAKFGIDTKLENQRFAAVRQFPWRRTGSIDASALDDMPGNPRFVPSDSGGIVIANTYWEARNAAAALELNMDDPEFSEKTDQGLEAELLGGLDQAGVEMFSSGDRISDADRNSNEQVIESDYFVPHLAHATMEPMNATADFDGIELRVWAPTQAPTVAVRALEAATGLPANQIKLKTTLSGGGFGRRGSPDFVLHAARAAIAERGPVKLIWSREEDIRHDKFRPPMASRLKGKLDANGRVIGLEQKNCGPGVWKNTRPELVNGTQDPLAIEGLSDGVYNVPNWQVDYVMTDPELPLGFWRSVGYSHNIFFLECFIDELAKAAGKDPYKFRRSMIAPDSRLLRVLDDVVERSGWSNSPGQGLAVFHSPRWRSPVATVANVSVEGSSVTVDSVYCSVDAGTAINPAVARSQIEGGIIFGMTAALHGSISFDKDGVIESNFADYRMVTWRDAPDIQVKIFEDGSAPGGMGELGTPAVIPAIVNGVSSLIGQRVRRLPLSKALS